MDLPILQKLKEGVKFDFETLADNTEKTDSFWEWWWEAKYHKGELQRPETIEDDDEILTETISKVFVDTLCYRNAIDDPLLTLLNEGVIPTSQTLDRELFRNLTLKAVWAGTSSLKDPCIIFAGGGYGSGKTTIIGQLAEHDAIPSSGMVGADMFKQLIPEYHLIKAVADGRASLTVQKECMMLVKRIFPLLVERKRSFVLDSSMSDQKETLSRIELAKLAGYRLIMVAVLTPLRTAIEQAMRRAQISRRFPHPNALPQSHVAFRQCFMDFVPLFDDILVYANGGEGGSVLKVAEKTSGKELAILDSEMFNAALEK